MKQKPFNVIMKKGTRGGMVEKRRGADIALDILTYVILILLTFVFIIPLWHVLMASFSRGESLLSHSGIVWWPVTPEGSGWNFGGYELMLNYPGILQGYGNTLLYVVAGTALGLVLNVIGGYVMCRKSKLQKFFIVFVMITMLFNGGMLPTYIVVHSLKLTGSRFAIILLTCTNALYMILSMNAFRGVNSATIEAAEIDGAGHFTIMFKVMLPQALSMMFVVILFTIVGIWNSWLEAKIYLPNGNTEMTWPLQLWINQINSENQNFLQSTNPDYNKYIMQYVLIVVATVPILIIATVFQKWIEKGVVVGGVKE